MNPQKVTVPEILRRKRGEKIAMLTAYDYPFARILDEAGVDVLLVGDTLGMVVQGLDTTLPVTVDEIIYHLKMVARARTRALVVGDLPFLSYQVSTEDALRNAGRMMKEGGAEAVKLEGGVNVAATIAALTAVDIPVMGHVGLTPQSVHRMGGHKVQGKKHGRMAGGRERLLEDAAAGGRSRRVCDRPRRHSARPRGRDHRALDRSRRSASARACTATARCSSCTTFSVSSTSSRRSSRSAT